MAYSKQKTLTDAAEWARKGQLDRAIEAYRKVIEHQPEEMRARLKIGDLLVHKDNLDDAVHTYLLVADRYANQGFARKAVAIYQRAIELQPHRLDIYLQLAEVLLGLGLAADVRETVTGALGALDAAASSDAMDPLEALTAMVRLDPDNVVARLRLGDLFFEHNRPAEARDELERAAGLLRASGKTDAFLLVGEKRLALQPENTPLRRELAGVYLRQDHPRRALALLQDCYDATATEPATLALLVKTFLAMDHQAQAIVAFKALAEAHDRVGQRAQRDGALRNILKLDPADPDALNGLGRQKSEAPETQPKPQPRPQTQASLRPEPEPEPEPALRSATEPVSAPDPMDLPELSLFETAQPSADLEATAMPAPETIPVASPRPDSRESGRFGSVDLTEAIDSLVAAEQTADHVPMLLAEARTYLETGLVDEARKHLENALAEAPDDTEASELLASLSPANLHAPESESSGEPPPADVSTTQRSLIDARDTANLAALLEPNWLEPSLVVDLD